jgi:hypothetical protein
MQLLVIADTRPLAHRVTKKDEVLRTVDMSDARASIGPL